MVEQTRLGSCIGIGLYVGEIPYRGQIRILGEAVMFSRYSYTLSKGSSGEEWWKEPTFL